MNLKILWSSRRTKSTKAYQRSKANTIFEVLSSQGKLCWKWFSSWLARNEALFFLHYMIAALPATPFPNLRQVFLRDIRNQPQTNVCLPMVVCIQVLEFQSSKRMSTMTKIQPGSVDFWLISLPSFAVYLAWLSKKNREEDINQEAHYPEPLSPIQALSHERLFIEIVFVQDLSRPNTQSTNQCAAQSCSFTGTFFVFWRSSDNNGGKHAGKFIGVIKKQKPILKIILPWKGWLKGTAHMEAPGNEAPALI